MGLKGACRTDSMKIDTLNFTSMSDVKIKQLQTPFNFTECDEDESASLFYTEHRANNDSERIVEYPHQSRLIIRGISFCDIVGARLITLSLLTKLWLSTFHRHDAEDHFFLIYLCSFLASDGYSSGFVIK